MIGMKRAFRPLLVAGTNPVIVASRICSAAFSFPA